MRIIGGTHKRKTILAVPGMATRPTSDRLRESLFNILANPVRSARVLDLFAGTGALGLEALSRGAQSCLFVDNQKQAIDVIRKNITACAMEDRSRILLWDISKNLNGIKHQTPPFDLVFMDPPYDQGLIERALAALADSQSLADGALIACEHAATDQLIEIPSPFSLTDQRTYGKTSVSFLVFNGSPADPRQA